MILSSLEHTTAFDKGELKVLQTKVRALMCFNISTCKAQGPIHVQSPTPTLNAKHNTHKPSPHMPQFHELAEKQGNPNTITEDEFREALGAIGIIESDQVSL